MEGVIRDPYYDSLRNNSLIIALNCIYPDDNCFCASIGTGPDVKEGYDLLITELREAIVLESGSLAGDRIKKALPQERASDIDILEKKSRLDSCRNMFKKTIRFNELPMLIYQNLEHQRWIDMRRPDFSKHSS